MSKTFWVKTQGPRGPRGGRGVCQGFVVAAASAEEAEFIVTRSLYWDEGAVIKEVTEVPHILRVTVA